MRKPQSKSPTFEWVSLRCMCVGRRSHPLHPQASPLLLVYLGAECLTCAAGNVLPDRLGYYISHRYWAGNWCSMLFFVRNTQPVADKLSRVKALV